MDSMNRREFVTLCAGSVGSVLFSGTRNACCQVKFENKTLDIHVGSKQPNIILFLVDDMGWQDTSVPFHSTTSHMC